MPEALMKRNQEINGERLSTLEAAQRLGITIMCSASILHVEENLKLSQVPPVPWEQYSKLFSSQ